MGLRRLLAASHPEPAVGVTAVAVALAVAGGRSAPGSVAVAAAVLAGQLSVGWHNDWLDAERDRLAGRRDKPLAVGDLDRSSVAVAAAVAVVAVVPLSLLSGWRAGTAHIVAVAAAWAYNARLKATVMSWLPYVVAFSLLTAFVSLGSTGQAVPPWWELLTAGLLGAGAHLANAAPDVDADLAQGVGGLPARLGARRSIAGAVVLLLAATAVVVTGPGQAGPFGLVALVAAAAVVSVGVAAGRRPGSRAPFRAAMAVAAVDAVALVVTVAR